MKLKNLSNEELEALAYDDIAFAILKAYGKKMKIQTLFKKICKLLSLSEKEFEDKIADFFELLSTDKRFIMLPNGYWDLRNNHSKKIELEDDDDDDELVLELEDLEDDDEEEIDATDDDDDIDDGLGDLVIIDTNKDDQDDL
ncbi:MAG TPA: DNA-directed RNA polymerase subunit delta [Bacilli bacterium]|nr:DNA-directed RNA polymerase subunit delta [Bacilli bacterium]